MTFVDQKPDLDVLAHHGVKGMKWGVKKSRSVEIRAARDRQSQRMHTGKDVIKGHSAYEDKVMARHMTRGDLAVGVLLGGPVGAMYVKALRTGISEGKNQKTLHARAQK